MPAELPAELILPAPVGGRIHSDVRTVRLGDVDRSGSLRLDATARLLQDIATDDASDAGLDRRFGWLVRRTKVQIAAPATLGEHLELGTWCTGIGRSWAERRTSLIGDRGASIETVSLWIQVDVGTGKPAQIAADFTAAYGTTAAGRKVSARLALGAPADDTDHVPGQTPGVTRTAWVVRRTDIDPFDHVNNAATWAFVEETIDLGDRRGVAELEYHHPIEHGQAIDVVTTTADDHADAWLVSDGVVHAAARWTPA